MTLPVLVEGKNSMASVDGLPCRLDTPTLSPAGWEEPATAAVRAIETAIAPRLKKAAEAVYDDLLYYVQQYLLENVLHNVQSQLDAANRQALYDRQRASKAEAIATDLMLGLYTAACAMERVANSFAEGHAPDELVATAQASRALIARLNSSPAQVPGENSREDHTKAEASQS